MAETAEGYSRLKSPRGIVQQVLRGIPVSDMPGLLSCLQCRQCSQTCPAGIDVAGMIARLRSRLDDRFFTVCPACGRRLYPEDAARYLSLAANAGYEAPLTYPMLCPSCKRRIYARNNS